jgi:hypothetical protein
MQFSIVFVNMNPFYLIARTIFDIFRINIKNTFKLRISEYLGTIWSFLIIGITYRNIDLKWQCITTRRTIIASARPPLLSNEEEFFLLYYFFEVLECLDILFL